MISDRNIDNGEPGNQRGPLSYWISDQEPLDVFTNWRQISEDEFKDRLVTAADQFPDVSHAAQEEQKHVTFFVHGYNTGWEEAARRYQQICADLSCGDESLGLCISFDWPSYGSILGYYPDRAHARECAIDLTEVLSHLYDWLLEKQRATIANPKDEIGRASCRERV